MKKNRIKTYKQATVNTVILVIILCLFVYLGVQLSRNLSATVSTQRTQIITDRDYVYLSGYIFRDETAVVSSQKGVPDYTVQNGEKVNVNGTYLNFYPLSDSSDKRIDSLRQELKELSAQLDRLNSNHAGSGVIADLSHIEAALSRTYYTYTDAVLNGDLSSARTGGEALLGALVDHAVITGKEGTLADLTATVKEKKEALLDSLDSAPQPHIADQSCYFFYETDGYEGIFSNAALESLTYEDLLALADREPQQLDNLLGRKIFSPHWYLALPADKEICARFTEGEVYTVSYSDAGNLTAQMLLERIYTDEQGAYLLFSSADINRTADISRMQNVKILMASESGYRIPADSLTQLNGQDGVYILIGTVVEFRRVTVIGEGNGYYLVETYERDLAALEEAGVENKIPYLYINDLIITSGNDLYDGKLLD